MKHLFWGVTIFEDFFGGAGTILAGIRGFLMSFKKSWLTIPVRRILEYTPWDDYLL